MNTLIDRFFTVLKASLVASVLLALGVVTLYVPNDWNHIPTAEAGGGAGGLATEVTQWLNRIQLAGINLSTSGLLAKEMTLDGVAWAIAKQLVASMTQSIVDWINSGFNGSPMFVQDIEGFLRDAADKAIGEYIQDLGGVGSFICSPFRLDVQVAIALQYELDRVDQPAPTCTLSGVLQNIEGFLSGVQDSFSQNGGWEAWFDITSAPAIYTPFGATIAAEVGAKARIVNAKGEEYSLLDFGDGFISNKVCEQVDTPSGKKEQCKVSLPGATISASLNKWLGTSADTLVTADEIDEIIGALFSQLSQKLFSGTAGLLGLSAGTGHTYSGYSSGSYLGDLVNEAGNTTNDSDAVKLMQDARAVQQTLVDAANAYQPKLETAANASTTSSDLAAQAKEAATSAATVKDKATKNIAMLDIVLSQYSDQGASADEKTAALKTYTSLNLYTERDVTGYTDIWEKILQEIERAAQAAATEA